MMLHRASLFVSLLSLTACGSDASAPARVDAAVDAGASGSSGLIATICANARRLNCAGAPTCDSEASMTFASLPARCDAVAQSYLTCVVTANATRCVDFTRGQAPGCETASAAVSACANGGMTAQGDAAVDVPMPSTDVPMPSTDVPMPSTDVPAAPEDVALVDASTPADADDPGMAYCDAVRRRSCSGAASCADEVAAFFNRVPASCAEAVRAYYRCAAMVAETRCLQGKSYYMECDAMSTAISACIADAGSP